MFDLSLQLTPGVHWQVTKGLTDYAHACAAMAAHVRQIRTGTAGELVWHLEHPSILTAGSSSRKEDLRAPAAFPIFWTRRGGQWTYHGPGQRVVYVMLDLTRAHGLVGPHDARAYIGGLEEWIIRALAKLGVSGERREGRVGVWVVGPTIRTREAKIAAIGVRITRWVTWHGLALNVAPNLSHFGSIVPCGIEEYGVTSLAELGVHATMDAVDAALFTAWPDVFGDGEQSPGPLVGPP